MTKEKKSTNSKKTSHSGTKAAAKDSTKGSAKTLDAKKVTEKAETTKSKSAPVTTPASSVSAQVTMSPKSGLNSSLLVGDPTLLDDTEVVLTDAEGRRYCRATDCDQIGVVDGYCRYHYLYFWKKIQVRKKILADGKLERYIDELTSRYTDKFIELLRKDLRTEKDFMAAVQELELDDSASSASAQDEDEAKNYIEEISGVASESSGRDDEY